MTESSEARLSIPDLVPLAQVGPQPFFHVALHIPQSLAAVPEVEVSDPAAHGRIDRPNNCIERHRRSMLQRQRGHGP